MTGVTGSGAGPYTLTVAASGMPTDGTLIPRLALNAVTDLGGNPGPLFATDATAGNVVLAPQAPQVVGRQGDNLISWTPSSGDNVTGYKVYWGTSAASLSNSATVPGRSSSLFDHTGRTIGTPYFYAVAPVDASGNEGTRTATVSATPTFTADTRLTCTGAAQTYVVPSGVSWITVDALGARGGENSSAARLSAGGRGGRTQAVMPVTAGESLQVNVGCTTTTGTGGWNGGAAGGVTPGSGGGGATDIRRGGTALTNRVLVAGGGGGAGGSGGAPNSGGAGGGLVGGNGGSANFDGVTYIGGRGGSQAAGGLGGLWTSLVGNAGTSGIGGASTSGYQGGGGGGGYYGGGGGGAHNGGGGGSSYVVPAALDAQLTQGSTLSTDAGPEFGFGWCTASTDYPCRIRLGDGAAVIAAGAGR